MPSSNKLPRRRINPAWHSWVRTCKFARAQARRFKAEISPHGPKWSAKMVAHWERRAAGLVKLEPPKYID